MGVVLFQLARGHAGILVHQEEGRPGGQLARRHQDNADAVHHADDAALQHLLGGVAVADERRILHQQIAVAIGAEGIAVVNGHIQIAHVLHAV